MKLKVIGNDLDMPDKYILVTRTNNNYHLSAIRDFNTLEESQLCKHNWHGDNVKYQIEHNGQIIESGIC